MGVGFKNFDDIGFKCLYHQIEGGAINGSR